MNSPFLLSESVRISVSAPPSPDAEDEEQIFDAHVVAASGEMLSVALNNGGATEAPLFTPSTRYIVRKSIVSGVLEFDATGHSHWDAEKLTLTLTLLGTRREIQRRSFCRIEHCSEVRYRSLAETVPPSWRIAELCEVSLGGASLKLKNDKLEIGQTLLAEFELNGEAFSLPAVVRRSIPSQQIGDSLYFGIEYLDPEKKQLNRLAKAMTHLQLKLISSRLKID